jgi:hypothetical protein
VRLIAKSSKDILNYESDFDLRSAFFWDHSTTTFTYQNPPFYSSYSWLFKLQQVSLTAIETLAEAMKADLRET